MRRAASCCALFVIACGPSHRPQGDDLDAAGDCTNGTRRCDGNTFEVCENGSWTTVDQCPVFCSIDGCTNCDGPDCMTAACGDAMNQQSYIGCEYWAVDLDNATEVYGIPIPVAGMECAVWPSSKQMMGGVKVCYAPNGAGLAGACDDPGDQCPAGWTCTAVPSADVPSVCALDGDHAPFAVVVSNPQPNIVAVTVEVVSGQSMTVTVGPGEIKALFPQQMGFADQGIDGTGTFHRAYKVTSNAPIVAYQFNPLNNVDVFSNDASLLLPRTSFDKRYIAVSYPTLTRRYSNGTPGKDNYNGYVTAVAWDDNTQIQVTPTANTVAGNDGTPALMPGQPTTFTLNKFDVLNLSAAAGSDPVTNDGLNGGDLTGTVFQSLNGKTFGVFGGHEAVRISAPSSNCCADHLEEMMFPTSTWGKQFAVARTVVRRDAPDILRIVAGTAGTQIGFAPVPMDGPCPVLGPSQYCDVHITAPTEVTATQPVTVAHLMMSAIQDGGPPVGTGDPSLGIVPPVEQYRTDYKFLAPMDYDEQYVDIVAVAGDVVTLDGTTVTGWTPFGSGRAAATVPLTVGPHTVSCNAKCSVEVYGWSQAVSYLFAGGLDLKPIVIE
jgi:IgGFc binding protein